jgi:alpha-ribazole phosphatase/probable phosphoglycerate mutase
MKLYVVRHGQTALNKKEFLNGQIDEPLDETGHEQVTQVVQTLHQTSFDAIYSSTLTRAIQTAQPIADDQQLVLRTDPRLMEVDPGSFAGQSYESLKPIFGMSSRELLSTYQYDFRPYGGEAYEQVQDRVASFLTDLGQTDAQSVLIVTHGGILRVIHYLVTGQKATPFANASVQEYTFDPKKGLQG